MCRQERAKPSGESVGGFVQGHVFVILQTVRGTGFHEPHQADEAESSTERDNGKHAGRPRVKFASVSELLEASRRSVRR